MPDAVPKVLLAGNDLTSGVLWGFRLLEKKFTISTEPNLGEVIQRYLDEFPNLVVLDISPLDEKALNFIKDVRQEVAVPLLLLISPQNEEEAIIHAYQSGADDCILKPINPPVLYAKIAAWLRRCIYAPTNMLTPLRVGNVHLVPMERTVRVGGGPPVRLTNTEARLLYVLMSQAGVAIASEEIIHRVWSFDQDVEYAVLKNMIYRLRHKLEQEPASLHCITTIPGYGYKFDLCP